MRKSDTSTVSGQTDIQVFYDFKCGFPKKAENPEHRIGYYTPRLKADERVAGNETVAEQANNQCENTVIKLRP